MFSYPRFEIDLGSPIQYIPLLAGTTLLWLLWKKQGRIGRAQIAAALFFVMTLGPMLGFIPLFTFRYSFVADHYQYVASIGPIALFAAGLAQLERRWPLPRGVFFAASAVLLLAIGSLTSWQSRIYENRETLWRDTIAKNSQSWIAYTNLARHYVVEKRWPEAVSAYNAVLEIRPDTHQAHIGIAEVMKATARPEQARRHLEAALALDPNQPETHRELAVFAWQRGEGEAAIAHYEAVIRLVPDSAKAHFLLGRGLDRLGRPRVALESYQRVLALEPDHEGALRALSAKRQP
jgi:tetratricopeptide (TPR) repeat protein